MCKLRSYFVFAAIGVVIASCGSGPKDANAAYMPIYAVSGGGALTYACTASSGTLALAATLAGTGVNRDGSGASPATIFGDATGTVDSAVTDPLVDVTYTWSFGDTNASGTGKWAYGSNPNQNSMDAATGTIVAHTYVIPNGGGSLSPTITVTAFDGTNTASCQMTTSIVDPNTAYAATNTTCVYTTTLGTGCPSGATQLATSSISTALGATYIGTGKRVLFKCGDTFTGDGVVIPGGIHNFSIGAYGGCESTQTSRPIFQATSTSSIIYFTFGSSVSTDGRMADIDCEGNGFTPDGCFNTQLSGSNSNVLYQTTLYNLYSNLMRTNFSTSQGAQFAIVRSVQTGMNGASIGTFINSSGNWPSQWVPPGDHDSMAYQALIGSSFDGTGHTYTAQETVRFGAARKTYIANSDFKNAGTGGAVLKYTDGDGANTGNWVGIYSGPGAITDNFFGGDSGSQLVEISPQNGGVDERIHEIQIERNLFNGNTGTLSSYNRQLYLSGQNMRVANNVFAAAGTQIDMVTRGNFPVFTTSGLRIYNNTCTSLLNTDVGYRCWEITPASGSWSSAGPAPVGTIVKNNLVYFPNKAGSITGEDLGTSSVISNNSTSVTANPAFTNVSGLLDVTSDFKPTANYTGGTSVPSWYDALGVAWGGVWDLGAVKH